MKEYFNRVFEQTKPSPEQKEAMLSRLLKPERKVVPMKKLKKLTVAGIAAALMVISCTAAVVTGLDQRLLDYFGANQEQAELLLPGAMEVDITAEDNGAVLHVTQTLTDRYNIMIVADFIAPEGTVLDMKEELDVSRCFGGMTSSMPDLLDQAGAAIDPQGGWGWQTKVLDDGAPLDNHLSLLFRMELEKGIQADWGITGMALRNKNLFRYDPEEDHYVTVYSGDWSCQIPLTWQDIGRSVQPNQMVGELDGIDITLTELYLSPMTMRLQFKSEVPIPQQFGGGIGNRWLQLVNCDNTTLTTRSGKAIPLTDLGGSSGDQDKDCMFRLDEITSLDDLEGGILNIRIEGGSVDVPLNGLVPAE